MNGTAAGLVLAFLLATAYGALFHVLMGGPARRLVLYVLAAWTGFTLGHFAGEMLQLSWLQMGTLQLASASIGAWVALLMSWWLAGKQT